MPDVTLWMPPTYGRGWLLWRAGYGWPYNLRMWWGHLVRLAGFATIGEQGCICCEYWEPTGRFWPQWFWRTRWYKRHQRYECPACDDQGRPDPEEWAYYEGLWDTGALP